MGEPMTPYNIEDFSDAEVQMEINSIIDVCDTVAHIPCVSAEKVRIAWKLHQRLLNGNFKRVIVKGGSIKLDTFKGAIPTTATTNLTAAPWKIIVTPILKPGAKSYRPH